MKQRIAAWLAGTILCASCATAAAQVPVEDFARQSEIFSASLSPTGEYVALAVPTEDGMETRLEVVKLDGSGDTQVLRFARGQHVTDLLWSDDEQIVMARAKMEPLKARPYSYGELMSTDVRGKNQETLFAYVPDDMTKRGRRKDWGFASVVKVLRDEPGMVLVDFTAWPKSRGDEDLTTSIFKVDTRTGSRRMIEQTRETATFQFDHSGRPRLKLTTDDNDDPVLAYRPLPGDEWQPVPESLAGYWMSFRHVEADDNTAWAIIIDKDEPGRLYKVDLANGTRELVAGRPDVEIASLMYAGHDGPPFAVVYDEDKPTVQYLDTTSPWAGLHAGLLKAFPGQMISFLNWTRDDRKLLFMAWSDRNPGAYYIFDRDSKQVQLVNQLRPWMQAATLAPSRPISFQTRDGLTLHGLYTAPAGDGPKPMVVMPHGGPHGPYDTWGYDSDAQFLASRGYAVLQVNYRGSGGRGRAFMESGYREWGGKMQDDIADGVRWAIEQDLADPDRICTYGASYGGYAAMMQPIRYPDLYKCAIGYVGVYDLEVMKQEGDITDRDSGRRYLDRALGSDRAQLQAWSPAQNVDRITIPVLLFQGGIDKRVPMDQFTALTRAFEARGVPVETMVAKDEGHGFYKPEHRAELYRRMEAFLDRYIGD
jgi:dipeptidyl aminopeptidase/acylaminoacyl peptidase